MNIKKVFDNNKAWVTKQLQINDQYFDNLSKGQSPEILYIGCSDSRVTAEELMGVQPGEVFVHRNIANMVPNSDLNSMSVINYAVSILEVNHVVVCGHYNCGGIQAALRQEDMGILNPWLRNIRDVYRLHRKELDTITDQQRFDRLAELNVQEQCTNVLKTAEVQQAIFKRGLTVHGWIFDIRSGRLVDLNIDFKKIMADITEIYKIEAQ
jgi:carbonic anhydrase